MHVYIYTDILGYWLTGIWKGMGRGRDVGEGMWGKGENMDDLRGVRDEGVIDWLIGAYSPGFCAKRLKLGLEQWPEQVQVQFQ